MGGALSGRKVSCSRTKALKKKLSTGTSALAGTAISGSILLGREAVGCSSKKEEIGGFPGPPPSFR